MTDSEDKNHHGSHNGLLWVHNGPSLRRAKVDAIIVPTVRQPAYLRPAAELAASLGCPLVTLHSGRFTSAQSADLRVPAEIDLFAIDVPDPAALRLPELETSQLLADTRFARRTDTSAKRNLALMLCHMVGWERIVFLDDDIRVSDPDHLRCAAGLLDTYSAVGLAVGGFPDNSVVCHAYRMVGGPQDSFIGGGALVVGLSRSRSFFPDIYNEDWFYLLNAEKGLQPLAITGKAIQNPYDPFRTPDRARTEELGDVLAEGTFWLLDQGRSLADASDAAHWAEFLRRRNIFVGHVLRRVEQSAIEQGEKARMVAALKAALGRLARIEPRLCQQYMQAWTADWHQWQRHFDCLETGLSLEAAVRSLSKRGSRPLLWRARDQRKRALARRP